MDERERDVLRRLWFPVARQRDVAAGPVAGRLLGHRVVAFAAGGATVVATDRCPHRGVRLSLGRIDAGTLECAYHGWRFGPEGGCKLVPSQPGAHPAAGLELFPALVRYGLVWTVLDGPGAGAPEIPEVERAPEGWEVGVGQPFDVRCGLRSITENFRDSSHFAFVHRETFGDVSPLIPPYTVRREGWNLAWDLAVRFGAAPSATGPTDNGRSKYRFGATGDPAEATGDPAGAAPDGAGGDQLLHYRFRLPSLSYVLTEHPGGGSRLVCQAAAPAAGDGLECRVFWFVAADARFRERYGEVAEQVAIEARVFAEDVPIVEALDPPEAPLDLEGQAHVRADRYSIAYRALFRELLAGGPEGVGSGEPRSDAAPAPAATR